MNKQFIFTLIFAIIAIGAASAQTIYYVKPNATGINNGTSWTNAYTDLQSALIIAANNDQIWVAEGTYYPTSDNDRSKSFIIPAGVKVYGGFKGEDSETLSTRKGIKEATILSGDIDKNDGNGTDESKKKTNSYHVVVAIIKTNFNQKSVLDGFTITGGYANGDGSQNINGKNVPHYKGAGIYVETNGIGNEVTMNNNIITNNATSSSSISNGGGVYVNGVVAITNNRISNNTTSATTSSYGGGVYINGIATITNNTITNNTASATSSSGGGVYTIGASILIANNMIAHNAISASNGNGGGVYANGASFIVRNNTIANNIVDATTSSDGGAVYAKATSSIIINNTIVKNKLTGNTANQKRSGVYVYGVSAKIYNSIIWGNDGGIQLKEEGISHLVANCLVQGGYAGKTEMLDADPEFVDYLNNDFRLKANSPAVNKGSNSMYSASGGDLTKDVDLAGNPRLFNTIIDMGAYEYQLSTTIGIAEVDAGLKIYPTLTTGKVYIETLHGAIPTTELYTLTGKLLEKKQTTEIDLTNYPQGIYILRTEGKTIKIVKQ